MNKTGIELIAQERKEQIEKGYGSYDQEYTKYQLLSAAKAIMFRDIILWP